MKDRANKWLDSKKERFNLYNYCNLTGKEWEFCLCCKYRDIWGVRCNKRPCTTFCHFNRNASDRLLSVLQKKRRKRLRNNCNAYVTFDMSLQVSCDIKAIHFNLLVPSSLLPWSSLMQSKIQSVAWFACSAWF